MVAIIKTGNSIRRTFHYNENKVNEGVAECIMAANYPLDLGDMAESQRLNMLLKTAALNPDITRNSVHISLNFAPGEQLTNELLKEISSEYMERIGFGTQPYLVYRHDDAGHPHIHIATVKIRPDGSKIDMNNIGRNQSEAARIALELKYGLVNAEDHKRQAFQLKPVDAQKVQYGKSETKRAIGNVLESVLDRYKYTSLPELNAVLNLYNVSAERGTEASRIYKNRGLAYRVLDAGGQPVGVPVKASLFHNKPTLDYLEKQFLRNDVARQAYKNKVKANIDFVIKSRRPDTLESLAGALRNSGISMVLRENREGVVYGITYIDFRTKCVFNGSVLGKNYSTKGIQERLVPGVNRQGNTLLVSTGTAGKKEGTGSHSVTGTSVGKNIPQQGTGNEKSLLEQLLQHEYASQAVPFEWKKKKKKKKKR